MSQSVYIARIEGALQRVFDVPHCCRTALVVLPAIGLYLYGGDLFALKAALIGVYLLIVTEGVQPSGMLLLLHAAAIILSIGMFGLTFTKPWLFVPLCACYAAGTHRLACWGEAWRSIGLFSFIPALYLGCELHTAPDISAAYLHLLSLYPVAVIPVALVSFGRLYFSRHAAWREALRFYCRLKNPLPCCSVTPELKRLALDGAAIRALAVFFAAALVEHFHLDAGEWVIWSAASVSTGDMASTRRKHRDRLWGVLFGVSLGLCVSKWVPASDALYGLAVLGVSISIATLRNYRVAFAVRGCLCVVSAVALGHGSGIGWLRLGDVLLGGFVGLVAMYLYCSIIYRRRSQS